MNKPDQKRLPATIGFTGPSSARVLILGENPSKDELYEGKPFVDAAGVEVTKMLHEAGFLRADVRMGYVLRSLPTRGKVENEFVTKTQAAKEGIYEYAGKYPSHKLRADLAHLDNEIEQLHPDLIICLGNLPLWYVTSNWGVGKWRGSLLGMELSSGRQVKVLATYSHQLILKKWEWRYLAVHDMRKAFTWITKGITPAPEYFSIRPSYQDARLTLSNLLQSLDIGNKELIAVDIETRLRHIACIGIAWSESDAICIPLQSIEKEDGYWDTAEEESSLIYLLFKILTHPNAQVTGQNFNYDQQYMCKSWGFHTPVFWDTMTMHHVLFAGLPNALDFQSSLYLDDHVYWKDEGKEWNPKYHNEEQYWTYNCKDCVRTWRICIEQQRLYKQMKFKTTVHGSQWQIQHEMNEQILLAELRGVKIDQQLKLQLVSTCWEEIAKRENYINTAVGHPLNPRSPTKLQAFFYTDMGVKPILKYDPKSGTRRKTCNEDALNTIALRDILLSPICELLNEVRSLGTFKSVALQPPR